MFNFDIEALKKALAQQQGTGMGLPQIGNGPLTAQPPSIDVPTPDVFPRQRQPIGGGGIRQFQEPVHITEERRYTPPVNNQSQFARPERHTPNLNPAPPTPRAPVPEQYSDPVSEPPPPLSGYENRIAELMGRGMTREQAEANQKYVIGRGHDLNGDGFVTDTEYGSGYTSTMNSAVADQYKNTGNGNGSIYFDATQREDANGMSQQQGFEMIKQANDELLPEGESWGFSDNTQGGPYGGPSLYESDEWVNNIDYNAGKYGKTIGALTGQGNGSLSGRKGAGSMGDRNPNNGDPIVWTEGSVQKGVNLGEIVDTPAGRYMVVNGANGQLALKGLEGAKHGGGNYFFNMTNKGHHVGINPKTGDVWYQGAPEVLAAAERSSAAGGDFWTAFQGGPDDDGVWSKDRIDRFLNGGVNGTGGQSAGGQSTSGGVPVMGNVSDWKPVEEDRGPVWGSGLFSGETQSMRRAVMDNLEKKLLG